MIEQKETLFSLGDLVTTKNHPYFENTYNTLIKARAEYTPPILNIFEFNIPEYFNETTGKKAIQYHCMYYDTKTGDFDTKWFKENELKLIRSNTNNKGNSISNYLKTASKNTLINMQCILNSVDIELVKLKSNYEGSFNSNNNKITAHLDFLPPLLEIIEFVNSSTDKNYDKKTGKRVKNIQQIKCKWHNPVKSTFSEKILPIDILQLIDLPNSEQLRKIENYKNTDYYFYYSQNQEETKKIVIASIKNVVFNHYQFEIYGENLVTGKIEKLDYNQIFNISPIPLTTIENGDLSLFIDKEYPRIEDKQYKAILLEKDQYYYITYKDKYDILSKRIIKIIDQFDIEQTNENGVKTKNNIIESICFLRNQETRHFKYKGILKAVKMNPNLF
ncbi:hypothetical protein HX065_10405 [Myroides odoratimimus]|uniref:hypothetical protein n=1 Tax=Myroides odoratimimus TaxID=76832 RepID=UPI00257644BE|nr:hypothetical protein [Myroides odoratimimus]MDM1036027.1 hypothetical protein [Myroides odoratimimus]MDM1460455.1 hypothetical protein [Myroides odoratimimus]